jgi:PAS domain-containing protein
LPTDHSVTLLKDNGGGSKGVAAICRDITQRRRAQKEVKELNSVVHNAMDGIAICNSKGRLTYVNKLYAEIHGYTPDEMIGMHVMDLCKKDERLSKLEEKLESHKLIYTAKGILMDRYNLSEKASLERLQKESRNQRKKMKEIAQAVISSRSVLD